MYKKCNLCNSNRTQILISCIRCKNMYHNICYDKWLKQNTNSELLFYCPDCGFSSFNEEGIGYLIHERPTINMIEDDKCCSKCIIQ